MNCIMKKITDNFYLLTKKKQTWTEKQKTLLKKYCNYSIFHPIPKDYVDCVLYGSFNETTKECLYKAPDVVMLNFDICNGHRESLRGLICISFDGREKKGNKEYKYYYTDLIGNKGFGSSIASTVKKRKNIVTKSGKDMIEYWIKYGKRNKYDYFKLRAMEDVIGFYWKCGFRFNYDKKMKTFYNNEKWDLLIKKLNNFNKLFKLNQNRIMEKEKKEYDAFLERHFNRFMEGYYNINYLNKHIACCDMDYNTTLSQKRFNLRFQGYSMYYHF